MSRAGDLQCKLILLGNGSVGKTSIIGRFTEDGFRKVYKQVGAMTCAVWCAVALALPLKSMYVAHASLTLPRSLTHTLRRL